MKKEQNIKLSNDQVSKKTQWDSYKFELGSKESVDQINNEGRKIVKNFEN